MYQYPKSFLTVSQLIQKLIDAGMTINSHEEAEKALKTIGYYRFKGYCFHQFDHNTNKYVEGTEFADILKLYQFDLELSHLLFCYLLQIEVTLRARLVNAFQHTQDALILNDPSVFDNKERYWKNQGEITSQIARSNDVFIRHNFDNHDGAIPLWAAVEVMSFGTLSKVIKNLKSGNQSIFSTLVHDYRFKNTSGNMVNPSKRMFTSWIHSVSTMRNICAHNSRIYYRVISTAPELISSDMITPCPRFNGLYQIMLSMKYLRPNDESWIDFTTKFNELLNTYNGIFDINKMNFPNDWKQHFEF